MVKLLKNKVYILLIVAIITLLSGCNFHNSKKVSNNNSVGNSRDKKWIEDIDYLHENLPKNHKNAYHTYKDYRKNT